MADLTDPTQAALVDTNAQELTGDWRGYAHRIGSTSVPAPHSGLAPTQQLGEALFSHGWGQGLISFSAWLPDYRVLVVFPQRLARTSASVSYQ